VTSMFTVIARSCLRAYRNSSLIGACAGGFKYSTHPWVVFSLGGYCHRSP
jgi:hypothetical protein